MRRPFIILSILAISFLTFGHSFSQCHSGVQDLSLPVGDAPPMSRIHWARGFNPSYMQQHAQTASSASPDMTYHGGKILTTAVIQSIFWGTSWGNKAGDKITGMDKWYGGFSNSYYAATSDEYT